MNVNFEQLIIGLLIIIALLLIINTAKEAFNSFYDANYDKYNAMMRETDLSDADVNKMKLRSDVVRKMLNQNQLLALSTGSMDKNKFYYEMVNLSQNNTDILNKIYYNNFGLSEENKEKLLSIIYSTYKNDIESGNIPTIKIRRNTLYMVK